MIDLDLRTYNNLQRAIFKKYKKECGIVNDKVHFYIICSKIAMYRECELCYSTVKEIIKIVKRKGDENEALEK